LLFASKRLRRFVPYIVGGFVGLILFYALAVLNVVPGLSALLAPVAELFGKDTTFSNRSLIWDIIKEHIKLHPTLGTGYGGYWIGPVPSSPSYEFLGRLNFYPTESHNGYLEIVNDLGFIGLAALLGYLIAFVRQSMQLMRIDRNQGVLYLCFFCQQAVANLSESYWLQADFGFTVLTLATFGTARALMGHRLQEYFGTP
jgi:O-antigen ligase